MVESSCSIPRCSKGSKARGMCGTHYQRFRRTGSASPSRATGSGAALAWLDALCPPADDACVPWPLSTGKNGYGQLSVEGENRLAHRYVCEKVNGPPPPTFHQAAHGCGRPDCVNENHLRWATPAENTADKVSHGTQLYGEDCGSAKLTNTQAEAIRADNRYQREIAAEYGVTQKVISLIKLGNSYMKGPTT